MNPAYKNLDSKLRIAELTIGQWLGVMAGLAVAVVWGLYLSPFGPYVTLASAIYLGAIPAGAVLLASVSQLDAWLLLRSAVRWRRREGRFVPGPGGSARGYVLREDPQAQRAGNARREAVGVDLATLWEDP